MSSRSSRNIPNEIFGEFSDVGRSPKLQKSPQWRIARKNQPRASRQDATSITGSTSSSKRSMEEDMVRLHPERFGSNRQQQQQQRQDPNESQDLPAFESLFLQPRPPNGKIQVENNRMHRNTEVVLSNPPPESDGRRRKSVFGKSHKDKKQAKPLDKTKSKPSSPGPKNRLKMLNCFSSSGKPRDDEYEDEHRQQAAIQAYYQSHVSKGNIQEQDFDCCDEDDYGEGNSLAASLSMSMSVATEGSASIYTANPRKQSSPKKHNNNNMSPVNRSHTNIAKDILNDLEEEDDDDLDSLYRRRSFLDMEEEFEKRDSIPREEEMGPLSDTNGIRRQPQKQSPPPKPQSPPQTQYQQQYQKQKQTQKRISPTTSVVQGKVTPPRGPVSTSWMKHKSKMAQSSGDGQSVSFLSVGTGSTATTTTSRTTTSVVNLGQAQQQRHQIAASKAAANPLNRIGPRCHFCGEAHWIYDCPHMDESALGRDQRRFGTPGSKSGRGYESEISGLADDSFTTEGLNTTLDSTDTGRSSVGRGFCGTQLNPLHCQVCFRR